MPLSNQTGTLIVIVLIIIIIASIIYLFKKIKAKNIQKHQTQLNILKTNQQILEELKRDRS